MCILIYIYIYTHTYIWLSPERMATPRGKRAAGDQKTAFRRGLAPFASGGSRPVHVYMYIYIYIYIHISLSIYIYA